MLNARQLRGVVALLVCSNLLTLVLFTLGRQGREVDRAVEPQRSEHPMEDAVRLRQQRITLSRELNEAKRAQGQAVCKFTYLQRNHRPTERYDPHKMPVSSTGGWCYNEGKSNNVEHKMDGGLASALSSFLAGKTVASFGDGPGDYRKVILGHGKVKTYDAFDGAPFCEETSQGQVKFLDLTAPQYGMELYDWVVSLEVAEHIPAKFEHFFLDNLVRHAREGLVMSWATPDQDGVHHVNGRTLVYVREALQDRGFVLDSAAGAPLRESASMWWFRQNLHVYRRTDPSTASADDA